MNTVSISAMIVIALLAPAAHADPLDGPRYPGESRHERAPPPTYLPSWERTQRHESSSLDVACHVTLRLGVMHAMEG